MFNKFSLLSYGFIVSLLISFVSFGQENGPEPEMSLTHTTGDINVAIFNQGSIGTNPTFIGPGVTWLGVNGLFVGGVIFGTASKITVNGLIGWGLPGIVDIQNVSSNFAGGFTSDANFDQITEATIDDGLAPAPYGVEITQRSYSNTGEEFVFIRYGFTNTTGSMMPSAVGGIFIDWDIDAITFGSNSGGYTFFDNVCYQFGTVTPEYYFGIASLDGASGLRATTAGSIAIIRSQAYTFITSFDPAIDPNGDFRNWIGTSLGDIGPGETIWTTFAIVAGANLAEMETYVDQAKVKSAGLGWTTLIVSVDEIEVEVLGPLAFGLDQNYPNPFNPVTIIKYEIPELSLVTLKVFDVLGSKVVALVDEEKPAGSYEVEFNALALPSGIYFYKLQAGSFVETKKMVLMK